MILTPLLHPWSCPKISIVSASCPTADPDSLSSRGPVIFADGVEHVEQSAGGQRAPGMDDMAGYYEDVASSQLVDDPVDHQVENTLECIHDLLVGVRVRGQVRASVDVPVGQSHVLRMNEPRT